MTAFDCVVFGCDRHVVMPLGVSVSSLAAAGSQPPVFVLHDELGDRDRSRVAACADSRFPVEFVRVPGDLLRRELMPAHLPRAALFRLLIDDLLPREMASVLYLDVDLLVRRPLDQFPRVAGGAPLAAVRDAMRPWIGGDPALPWRVMGVDPAAPYFNSGVMLLDRRAWSQKRISLRALEVLARWRLPYGDQCALNLVVEGGFSELPPRWNLQTTHQIGDGSLAWVADAHDSVQEALDDPAVVHYTGPKKPWLAGPGPRYRTDWFDALDRTPWAGWRPHKAWLRRVRARAGSVARRGGTRSAGAAEEDVGEGRK